MGLPNRDYVRLKKLGLTDDDIKLLQSQQQTPKDMENWSKLEIDVKKILEILELGITYEEYRPMLKLGLTVEDIKILQELGLTAAEYNKYKKKGISPDDIKNSINSKKLMDAFKKLNLSSKEMKKLQGLDISAAQYEAYMKLGLTYNEVLAMAQLKLTAKAYMKMKSMGLTSEDIVNVINLETTPEVYMKMKELKLELIKMKKLIQLKISPSMFEKLNTLNIGFGHMEKFAGSGMTPVEYSKAMAYDNVGPKDFFPELDEQSEVSLDEKGKSEKDNVVTEAVKALEQDKTAKTHGQGETDNAPKKVDTVHEEYKKDKVLEQAEQDNATTEPRKQDNALSEQIKQENNTSQIIDILTDSKKPYSFQSKMNDLQSYTLSKEKELRNKNKHDVVVVQSSTGSKQSIDKLIRSSFQIATRVIILNANGVPNCMAFLYKKSYYLYAVCTCNIDSLRKCDLDQISELLKPYKRIDKLITKIVQRMWPGDPQQKFDRRLKVEKTTGFVRQLFAHKFDDINQKFTDVLDEYYNISKKRRE